MEILHDNTEIAHQLDGNFKSILRAMVGLFSPQKKKISFMQILTFWV